LNFRTRPWVADAWWRALPVIVEFFGRLNVAMTKPLFDAAPVAHLKRGGRWHAYHPLNPHLPA
jgi:hypothetical protein